MAINPNNIILYIQPIKRIDGKNTTIKKFEALMRYPQDDGSLKFPVQLLTAPSAIQREATIIMLKKIIDTLQKYPNTEISLNIDYDDITDTLTQNKILELIQASKVGSRIILEFIEEKKLPNKEEIINFMENAKKEGCKFALDDFGKGYATFDPLLSFPFDILKLDEVLTKNFTTDAKKYYIIDMIVNMCQRLEIETVAEYIETEETYTSAQFIGVTYAQGHLKTLGEAKPPIEYLR